MMFWLSPVGYWPLVQVNKDVRVKTGAQKKTLCNFECSVMSNFNIYIGNRGLKREYTEETLRVVLWQRQQVVLIHCKIITYNQRT